jgi:hypothetical protein
MSNVAKSSIGLVMSLAILAVSDSHCAAQQKKVDVPTLITQLKDKDESVRLKAAKELGKLKEKAKDAITALTAASDDPDEDVASVSKKSLAAIKEALGTGVANQPDKELKAKLDTIAKQLASKKLADKITGLEAAKNLEGDAAPLIQRICELVLVRDEKIATLAAGTLKAVSPKLHPIVLQLRATGDSSQQFPTIIQSISKLEYDGKPAIFLIYGMLNSQIDQIKLNTGIFPAGLKALRDLDDTSKAHFAIAKRYYTEHSSGNFRTEAIKALKFFAEKQKELRPEIANLIIAVNFKDETIKNSGPDIEFIEWIADFGKDAKAVVPKLKRHSLSPNVKLREAAEAAIEKIEADLKDKK